MRDTDPERLKILADAHGYFGVVNVRANIFQGYLIGPASYAASERVLNELRAARRKQSAELIPLELAEDSTTISTYEGVAAEDQTILANLCGSAAITAQRGEHNLTGAFGATIARLAQVRHFIVRAVETRGSVCTTFEPQPEIQMMALLSTKSPAQIMAERFLDDPEVKRVKQAIINKQLDALGFKPMRLN